MINYLISRHERLLLLLNSLHNFKVYLQRLSHHIRRRQGKPLRERNVGYAITLVDLDPDELLGVRGVFDIVAYTFLVRTFIIDKTRPWGDRECKEKERGK